jgi:hypothetical protein|tara:strand:+ start:464 stop:724 length:261 start_codon:yes stop_codon:yes gene_type:complete
VDLVQTLAKVDQMAKYKIIGNKKVMDKEKGDIISIDDEDVAKSLIKGGHIEPTTIKKKRARKKDGTFIKDDKSTPDINEAWEIDNG